MNILREGWRDDRAAMCKVFAFLWFYFVIIIGAIVVVWCSGYHVVAALMAGFEAGMWRGYSKVRS